MVRGWPRSALYALCMGAVAFAFAEGVARLATRVSPDNGMPAVGPMPLLPYRPDPAAVHDWIDQVGRATYLVLDPELGWTVLPGGRTPDGQYEANAQGARAPASRFYASTPPHGTVRMVTVGDSFTHGDGVSNSETWEARLEEARADLEVVNLGVGGYGTDQAFLRWRRDGRGLAAHFAILGLWPENVCRNLNVVRYFLAPNSGYGSKPRFVLESGALRLVGVPVLAGESLVTAVTAPERSAALREDYWMIADDVQPKWWYGLRLARAVASTATLYHRHAIRNRLYAGDDPSGIDLTVAIAEAFSDEASQAGAAPLVLVIPMRELLATYPDEGALPLTRALRARGLDVLDFGPTVTRVVREKGEAWCFQRDGHLTAACNQLLASWLIERLSPRLDAIKDGALRPELERSNGLVAHKAPPLAEHARHGARSEWPDIRRAM